MQVIAVTPFLDIILADQIQRTDQLHTFKICAVQLWHHGLHLGSIEHAHQNGLNDIIVMMTQSNLVASKFLRLAVEMSTAHSRTQITR